VTFGGDVENERIVNKVEPGRRQGLSALCKASAVNTDRSSKWSKFLSNDVMNDGEVISSHLVSDSVDDDSLLAASGYSTVNGLPSVVSTTFMLQENLEYTIVAYILEDFTYTSWSVAWELSC